MQSTGSGGPFWARIYRIFCNDVLAEASPLHIFDTTSCAVELEYHLRDLDRQETIRLAPNRRLSSMIERMLPK